MKKILFSLTSMLAVTILFITLTSQKRSDNKKFYYAFKEKIFIEEIPGKYVVKYKDAATARNNTAALRSKFSRTTNIQYQNETTVTLSGITQNIQQLLKDQTTDIALIKPAYRYQQQEMYYTSEILVEPNAGISIQEVLLKSGLSKHATIKGGKFYSVVDIAPTLDACEAANKIQESGLVKFSHPNFMMPVEKHQVIPNDTYFNNQYYLRNTGQVFNPVENHSGTPNADINAPFAWTTSTGNNAIIVAVIDEGLTPNHPDLPNTRQVRLNGSNFVPGENANDPTPGMHNNHGNSCSGIIAATQNNNEGISGIAPNVRIMPIKVFGQFATADNNGFANAIDFAWQNGAHVISNSWGVSGADNPNLVPAIVSAIQRAVTQGRGGLGSVVVFSASNTARRSVGNNGVVSFPSNVQINGVLTVGASDRNDLQSDYSPTSNAASANNQIIDIVAPSHRAYPPQAYQPTPGGIAGEGFEIWTIDIPGNNGYNQWNDAGFPVVAPAFGEVLPATGTNNLSYTGRFGGTSASCPQVAAVAALVLSVNNSLTQQQVFNVLTQSADRVGGYAYDGNRWCPQLGNGRLNACAALTLAPSGGFSVSGPNVVCNTGTFSVAGAPAGSIVWSSSNPAIATISQSGVLTKVTTGHVNVTATINFPNRCGNFTVVKIFVRLANPPADFVIQKNIVCQPGSIVQPQNISAVPSTPNATYHWSYRRNGGAITNLPYTTASFSHKFTLGSYELYGWALNECGESNEASTQFNIIQCPNLAGANTSPEQLSVDITPNPAASSVNITIHKNGDNVKTAAPAQIRIVEFVTPTGIVSYRKQFKSGLTSVSLQVSQLRNDLYTVRVFDGREWTSHKIMIKH